MIKRFLYISVSEPRGFKRSAAARAVASTAIALTLLLSTIERSSAAITYVESGGMVVGEGEVFSSRSDVASGGANWRAIPDEAAASGTHSNSRGGFIQNVPDGAGIGGGPTVAPSVNYDLSISTPGTYQLYLRSDGSTLNPGASDSIFADIVELKDGPGGTIADHYEFVHSVDGNFATIPWDGSAGFELNTAGGTPKVPATFAISSPGDYTLRISRREDGAALDAFVLQLDTLAAPTDVGPAISGTPFDVVKDSYVRLGNGGDDNFGGAGNVVIKNSGGGSTTRKGYLQFDISGLNTDAQLAQLDLVIETFNSGGGSPPDELTVEVFGLLDGVNEAWVEGTTLANITGPTPPNPLVFNNAPGNATGNGLTSDATLLGSFMVTDTTHAIGDHILFSSQALSDFLNLDNDGLVTLILRRTDSDGSANLGFASRENGTLDSARLVVIFPFVPEPNTFSLASLALLSLGFVGWRRRRR